MDAGLVKGVGDQRISRWRPAPQELMAAAKLMDSFEAVKIGENFGLDAQAMKAQRESGGGSKQSSATGNERAKQNLVTVVRRVYDANYIEPGRPCDFSFIRDVINKAGEESGLKVTSAEIKSALQMVGCPVRTNSVHADDLEAMWDALDNESA